RPRLRPRPHRDGDPVGHGGCAMNTGTRLGETVRRPLAQRLAEHDDPTSGRRPRGSKAWRGPERRVNVAPVVLVVDDEPDQLDVYRQGLEFAGYRVAVAGGGRVALDMALATHPDVIIM